MTPKEKAFDLFNQYLKILGGINSTDWVYFHGEEAKQCALIAIDELIESHLLLTTTHEPEPSIRCKRYWQEVKKEIEKL